MKSHAIVAAVLAAASLSAFAQPGVTSSGFPAASPHDAVAQATHRSPGTLPHAGFVLAKIDQTLTLDPVSHAIFRIPAAQGAAIHLLHERGKVLKTRYVRDKCVMEAEVPESVRRRLVEYLAKS